MIGIISHDAGGAEIISSYIRRQKMHCLFALEGPALKIFENKIGPVKNLSIEKAVQESSWVLCGTGWQSDLEYQGIQMARMYKKLSVAFLDHWINYRERFIRRGTMLLPDEIWVGDAIAQNMAIKTFPNSRIKLIENPYILDIKQELKVVQTSYRTKCDSVSALYVCEPIRDHMLQQFGDERYLGYVEEDALNYFLSNIKYLGQHIDRVMIRPHPSESPNKYDEICNQYNLPIVRGGGRSLVEEIAESDIVVGCESMAMVIGIIAGKRVISCVPPKGKRCVLPQSEIEHLQLLINC